MITSQADSAAMTDEAVRMIQFLQAVGTEEQRIAYAVLEGMRLQKAIGSAGGQESAVAG